MHSQTVEVAAFAHHVATEGFTVFFWRIELAAVDANVVAHGNRQGVYHVSSLLGGRVLEDFGQHIEERSPEGWVYGVQPTVEATLRDRLLDEGRTRPKTSGSPRGWRRRRLRLQEVWSWYGHHLSGGQTHLWVVAVASTAFKNSSHR